MHALRLPRRLLRSDFTAATLTGDTLSVHWQRRFPSRARAGRCHCRHPLLQRRFCLACGQMPLPPHSLHRLFRLPCGQMVLPPHSLHWCFSLPCGQMALPPHTLHRPFRLPCGQMSLPPHSLHWCFCLPCGQMPLPPHSLHWSFRLPCSHFARFRTLPSLSEGAPRSRDAAPPPVPSASSGNVRSYVCGSKHASSDGSGLIGFAAAAEQARPNVYATTRHYSSI